MAKKNFYAKSAFVLSVLVLFVLTQMFFMFPRSISYSHVYDGSTLTLFVQNQNYRDLRLILDVESAVDTTSVEAYVNKRRERAIDIPILGSDIIVNDNYGNTYDSHYFNPLDFEPFMFNVIIPTYNEKQNIKPLFYMIDNVFKRINMEYKIILIDDNSPDGTYHETLSFQKTIKLNAMKRHCKLGLGSAYKDALKYCDYDYVIILDADLSHDPNDIEKMIIKMDIENNNPSFDIICGSRYLRSSQSGTVGWDLKRKLTSRGANNLAQILLGLENTDLTGSYRLYRKEVFASLINKVQSNGYAYQMEILYLASINNFTIAEVPIVFHKRIHGESKLAAVEILGFIKSLVMLTIGM